MVALLLLVAAGFLCLCPLLQHFFATLGYRGAPLEVMVMMMAQHYYHYVVDNRAFDAVTTVQDLAFLWCFIV